MGAGRADAFDAEITDFGSVIARSSGPVEAAESVHRPQQETTNNANHSLLRIFTSFDDILIVLVGDVVRPVGHHRVLGR